MMERPARLDAWQLNSEPLLFVFILFSYLFYFVCMICIPDMNTDGTALLRGSASVLAICMPAFFYMRSEAAKRLRGEAERREKACFWRLLLLLLCAFFFGAFTATLAEGALQSHHIFLRFALPSEFSLASLASLFVFAFSSVLFPYGLFATYAFSRGYVGCFFAVVCLYSAIFFQSASAPFIFIFGLILLIVRWQTRAFLPVFLTNLVFLFGGYGVSIGLFSFDRFGALPEWIFLLITGVVALGTLIGAVHFRALKLLCKTRMRTPSQVFLRFTLLSVLFFAAAILLSALISNFLYVR